MLGIWSPTPSDGFRGGARRNVISSRRRVPRDPDARALTRSTALRPTALRRDDRAANARPPSRIRDDCRAGTLNRTPRRRPRRRSADRTLTRTRPRAEHRTSSGRSETRPRTPTSPRTWLGPSMRHVGATAGRTSPTLPPASAATTAPTWTNPSMSIGAILASRRRRRKMRSDRCPPRPTLRASPGRGPARVRPPRRRCPVRPRTARCARVRAAARGPR